MNPRSHPWLCLCNTHLVPVVFKMKVHVGPQEHAVRRWQVQKMLFQLPDEAAHRQVVCSEHPSINAPARARHRQAAVVHSRGRGEERRWGKARGGGGCEREHPTNDKFKIEEVIDGIGQLLDIFALQRDLAERGLALRL